MYFEIAVKWSKRDFLKNSNWSMPKTPSKMHMYDMVKINDTVFNLPPPNIPDFIGLKCRTVCKRVTVFPEITNER